MPEYEKNHVDKILTHDELKKFLLTVNASDKCPSCKKNIWSMLPPRNISQLILNELNNESNNGQFDFTGTMPAYTLICFTCGFIRLHALPVVNSANLAKINSKE